MKFTFPISHSLLKNLKRKKGQTLSEINETNENERNKFVCKKKIFFFYQI